MWEYLFKACLNICSKYVEIFVPSLVDICSKYVQIFCERKNYFGKWRNGRLAGGRSHSHLFCCHTEKGKAKLAPKKSKLLFPGTIFPNKLKTHNSRKILQNMLMLISCDTKWELEGGQLVLILKQFVFKLIFNILGLFVILQQQVF